ncbi:MAG: hypothetical protein RJQ09_10980 [Cyclobacteriaceae bacterium]
MNEERFKKFHAFLGEYLAKGVASFYMLTVGAVPVAWVVMYQDKAIALIAIFCGLGFTFPLFGILNYYHKEYQIFNHSRNRLFGYVVAPVLLISFYVLFPLITQQSSFRYMPNGIRTAIVKKSIVNHAGDNFVQLKTKLPGYFKGANESSRIQVEESFDSPLTGHFEFIVQAQCDEILNLDYSTNANQKPKKIEMPECECCEN